MKVRTVQEIIESEDCKGSWWPEMKAVLIQGGEIRAKAWWDVHEENFKKIDNIFRRKRE